MTKYIVPAISFIAGSCFGVVIMCCLAVNRFSDEDWDEEREVMEIAGGDREQDCEPCDYDDEADSEGSDGGGSYVSWEPETCERAEAE